MNTKACQSFSRALVFAILSASFAGCVTSFDLIEVGRGMAERKRGPEPESKWNELKIWRRVADNPPTYIPEGYPASAPRGEKDGKWIDDKRDGKRFFVPNRAVGSYPSEVLQGEAVKVANWHARQYSDTRPGIMVFP